MTQQSISTVQLSHQQLSLLVSLIVQYKVKWNNEGNLPLHIADLLDSTHYQLTTSCLPKES
jgi:hypothetical protein